MRQPMSLQCGKLLCTLDFEASRRKGISSLSLMIEDKSTSAPIHIINSLPEGALCHTDQDLAFL